MTATVRPAWPAAGSTVPRWSPAAAFIRSSTPRPGRPLPSYALATPADVDAPWPPPARHCRAGRRRRLPSGPRCWPSWRKLADEHADELVAEEVSQTGKPVRLATRVRRAGQRRQHRLLRRCGPPSGGQGHRRVLRRPHLEHPARGVGVVATITPWNYPLQMAVWKVMPALAAGAASSSNPRSSRR